MYFSGSQAAAPLSGMESGLGSRLSSSATVPMTLAERTADQIIYREDPALMSGSTSQVYVQVAPNSHTEETRQTASGQLITHTETRETLNPLITPAQPSAPALIREEKLPATVSTRAYEVFRKDPTTLYPGSKIISVNQPGPVTTPSGSVYDPITNTVTSAFNGQITYVQPALHIGSTLQRFPDMPTVGLQPVISSSAGYTQIGQPSGGIGGSVMGGSGMGGGIGLGGGYTTTSGGGTTTTTTTTMGPTTGYITTSSMNATPGFPTQMLMQNGLGGGYTNYGSGTTYIQQQPTSYYGQGDQIYRTSFRSDNQPIEQQSGGGGGSYTIQNSNGLTTQHYESGPITTTTTWGGDGTSGYEGGYTTTTYSEEQTRKTYTTPQTATKIVSTSGPTPMTQYTATPVTQYSRQTSQHN